MSWWEGLDADPGVGEVERVRVALKQIAATQAAIRDDVRAALAAVYSGAEMTEAEALLDQLGDRGLRVVRL